MIITDAQSFLQAGIKAAKNGRLEEAREQLKKATELNPNNAYAWIWLAGVTDKPEISITYLKQSLAIDPNNKHAQDGLRWAEQKLDQLKSTWVCPLCYTNLPRQTTECTGCGSILTLSEPQKLLNNHTVDEVRIKAAINYYQEIGSLRKGDNFNRHFNLGLAYLNGRNFADGIRHLNRALELRPDDKILSANLRLLLKQPEIIAALAPAQSEINKVPLSLGTVLIVDDSPTVRKLVSLVLERHNYKVLTASDGFEAVSMVGNAVPDIILLDITMPKMDGYQVCKIMRDNDFTRDIPIIMLSSKDGFFDKVRGRIAGSTAYITKPFQPDQLLKTLQKHL